MKNIYIKTTWIDNKTPVNAANLNKIEGAIADLYSNALSASDFKEGKGISITPTLDKQLEIAVTDGVQTSNSCIGVDVLQETPATPEKNRLYFILDQETKILKKIMINGVIIFGA